MKHLRSALAGAVGLSLVTIALAMPVSANAASASWSFEPSSWDFGARAPEEGFSGAHPFVLTNTGAVALEPALINLTPGSGEGGEFNFKGGGCHVALGPGESCDIEATFRATGGGPATATLEVSERNSLAPPAVASLSGTGGEPSVEIEPSPVDFGTITLPFGAALPLGSTRIVTVTNGGSASLTFKVIEFEELTASASRANFFGGRASSRAGGCLYGDHTTVAPGGSCVLEYELSPRDPGTFQAEIQFFDNAPDSPQTITLSGAAAEAAPPLVRDPQAPAPPVLTREPGRRTKARDATFAFSGDSITARFECRLGGGPVFNFCRSPFHLRKLKPGRHLFSVRPIGGDGITGPLVTYRWRILR